MLIIRPPSSHLQAVKCFCVSPKRKKEKNKDKLLMRFEPGTLQFIVRLFTTSHAPTQPTQQRREDMRGMRKRQAPRFELRSFVFICCLDAEP